jgi:hypothetical protein
MKVVLFYIVVALTAAGMILLSMGQMLAPARPAPQAGVIRGVARHFDAKALSHSSPSPAHYVYVNQEWLSAPTGLQIATKRTWRLPGAGLAGIQLQLAPEVGAALAGKKLHVSIGVLPLSGGTTARELAVSAANGGPVHWVRQPITTESGKLEFDLPPSNRPVTSIGFWPFSDRPEWDADYGVEITGVDITTP